MKKTEYRMFTVPDVFVFLAVAAIAVLLLLSGKSGKKGGYLQIISESGEKTVSLENDAVFDIESRGIIITVEINDGYAFVSESTCPDQICRKTGRIGKNSQTIICAPAGVALKIVSESEDGYDAVSH